MYGKSFVLVKPDGMNKEIKDEIIQTIQNRSISVVKAMYLLFRNIGEVTS